MQPVFALAITTEMVDLVIALGTILNAILVYRQHTKTEETKQLAIQAAANAEAVKKALAEATAAKVITDEAARVAAELADKKLDKLSETASATKEVADKTLKETNHNYQKMQEESAQSRAALEKANQQIIALNKEVAAIAQALVREQSNPQQATGSSASQVEQDEIHIVKLEGELTSNTQPESEE